MIETLRGLKPRSSHSPICVGVPGIFAPHVLENLRAAGARRITTRTRIVDDNENVASWLGQPWHRRASDKQDIGKDTSA